MAGRSVRLSDVKGSDSEAWPIWWFIRAQDRWWTDLDGYRDTIVDEVQRGIDRLGDALVAAAAVRVEGAPVEDA